MANLTITVDAETLKRARIRAIERGESVNQFLSEQLKRYVDDDPDAEKWRQDREKWLAVVEKYAGRSSSSPWTREELYDERFDRYGADR